MTIQQVFEQLRRRREMALIPYLTAGFPSLDESMQALRTIAESGADLVELGVPFCDPVADGPTIQQASQDALDGGVTLPGIFDALKREPVSIPLIIMSYLNPLLALGEERLWKEMADAGVSGLVVPDLPLEEAGGWVEATRSRGISLILLVAPTSSGERAAEIAACCGGFIYCVSITGTTGARDGLSDDLAPVLERLRGATNLPLAVGFGISRPSQIIELRGKADGVVVGSRIVDAIRNGEDLRELVGQLKEATRSKSHVGSHGAESDG